MELRHPLVLLATNSRTPATAFVALMYALAVAALASGPVVAQETADDWHFAATIYGWFPDIGGQTAMPVGDNTIDVDVSTILDHLEMTFQSSFEFSKGRWGGYTDIVYMDLGETKTRSRDITIGNVTLPTAITANVEFDLRSLFWTIAGTYRIGSGENVVDLLAGARLADLKQQLDWEFVGDFGPNPPAPLTGSRKVSADQSDAIVGAKGQVSLGSARRWILPWYVDIGTGDSDLTWRASLGLSHTFSWGEVTIAWAVLTYELADSPIEDIDFSGPSIGATFRW